MDKRYVAKFGKHLKKMREERNMTQDDFDCDRVSRSTVGHVEIASNDITLTKVKAIADIMGVHPKELFDFE